MSGRKLKRKPGKRRRKHERKAVAVAAQWSGAVSVDDAVIALMKRIAPKP